MSSGTTNRPSHSNSCFWSHQVNSCHKLKVNFPLSFTSMSIHQSFTNDSFLIQLQHGEQKHIPPHKMHPLVSNTHINSHIQLTWKMTTHICDVHFCLLTCPFLSHDSVCIFVSVDNKVTIAIDPKIYMVPLWWQLMHWIFPPTASLNRICDVFMSHFNVSP